VTFSYHPNPPVRGHILLFTRLIPKLFYTNLFILSWHPLSTFNPNRHDSPTSSHMRESYTLCLAESYKPNKSGSISRPVFSGISYSKILSKLLPCTKACILSVPIGLSLSNIVRMSISDTLSMNCILSQKLRWSLILRLSLRTFSRFP
jgi:hypothetical protein